MAEYKKFKLIGLGAFAEVWQCHPINNPQNIYAMKILKSHVSLTDEKRFKKEINKLKRLDHPNIVKIIDQNFNEKPYYYIMPRYKNSIQEVLNKIIGNEDSIVKIYKQILNAMEYAHNNNILHRDLKPQNILWNNDDDIVIADFGIAKDLSADPNFTTMLTDFNSPLGTAGYCPPQQFYDGFIPSVQSDIYNLGRILNILYGKPTNEKIIDIIERCTSWNEKDRHENINSLKAEFNMIFHEEDEQLETIINFFSISDLKISMGRWNEIIKKLIEEIKNPKNKIDSHKNKNILLKILMLDKYHLDCMNMSDSNILKKYLPTLKKEIDNLDNSPEQSEKIIDQYYEIRKIIDKDFKSGYEIKFETYKLKPSQEEIDTIYDKNCLIILDKLQNFRSGLSMKEMFGWHRFPIKHNLICMGFRLNLRHFIKFNHVNKISYLNFKSNTKIPLVITETGLEERIRLRLKIGHEKKLIVVSNSDYHLTDDDSRLLMQIIRENQITEIIQNGVSGIDKEVKQLKNDRGLFYKEFKADWKKNISEADLIRNKEMVKYANICIFFSSGKEMSNMLKLAKDHELKIYISNDYSRRKE